MMPIRQTYRMILGSALLLSPAIVLAQEPIVPTQPQMMPSASASSSTRSNQQDSTSAPGQTGQEMQDKKFLRDFAQGGLAEVKMGQLAAGKGSSDEVKAFGSKMVTDHTQMGKDIEPIADAMGIRLPKDLSKADQAEYDKLNALSGEDFDKAYITLMLADHRKDLRAFRQEAMSTNDTTLHAEIDKSFAVVREHMGMVVKMAKEKGIAVPAPPQRAGAAPPPPPTQ